MINIKKYALIVLVFMAWVVSTTIYTYKIKQTNASTNNAIQYVENADRNIEQAKEKNVMCTAYVENFWELMHSELYPKRECGVQNAITGDIEKHQNCDEEYRSHIKAK